MIPSDLENGEDEDDDLDNEDGKLADEDEEFD
jgi:hypothetical protein